MPHCDALLLPVTVARGPSKQKQILLTSTAIVPETGISVGPGQQPNKVKHRDSVSSASFRRKTLASQSSDMTLSVRGSQSDSWSNPLQQGRCACLLFNKYQSATLRTAHVGSSSAAFLRLCDVGSAGWAKQLLLLGRSVGNSNVGKSTVNKEMWKCKKLFWKKIL